MHNTHTHTHTHTHAQTHTNTHTHTQFALIRVRFPDGYIIQGKFRPAEKHRAVKLWVDPPAWHEAHICVWWHDLFMFARLSHVCGCSKMGQSSIVMCLVHLCDVTRHDDTYLWETWLIHVCMAASCVWLFKWGLIHYCNMFLTSLWHDSTWWHVLVIVPSCRVMSQKRMKHVIHILTGWVMSHRGIFRISLWHDQHHDTQLRWHMTHSLKMWVDLLVQRDTINDHYIWWHTQQLHLMTHLTLTYTTRWHTGPLHLRDMALKCMSHGGSCEQSCLRMVDIFQKSGHGSFYVVSYIFVRFYVS